MNGWAIPGGLLLLFVAAQRLLFLAPTPLGWLMYLANVVSETAIRKAKLGRAGLDLACSSAGLALLWAGGAPLSGLCAAAALLLALELGGRLRERAILTATYTLVDPITLKGAAASRTRSLAAAYPAPSAHPDLTLSVIGPFVARVPRYRLGTLAVGRQFTTRLCLGNHTTVPTQTAIRVRVIGSAAVACEPSGEILVPRLAVASVHLLCQSWKVTAPDGAGVLRLEVEWGHVSRRFDLHYEACLPPVELRAASVELTRYPGACRSAFAWRGDMDLYDESTLQSIEGLEVAFGLAARYCLPQTMYLSTRLSLDEAAARQWADHHGIERGAARIPQFIAWMRQNVDLRHDCAYPFTSPKRFVIELGNHGHLHFGTDTSAAPENGWKPKAKLGAGAYPWLSGDRSSFAEQRDNALEARRLCEKFFGYAPRSWAMPDRTNDRHTAAAMEAAGCEVLSGSDITARDNVLRQPPPHHPAGTAAVELTNRHPGDPSHVAHAAMFRFWLHRGHRRGIPILFFCHQHLRLWNGHACLRLTEHVLRYALSAFHGDLHVNTVFGVGKYWREVLSPQTRRVSVSLHGGVVRVRNASDFDLKDAPLDILTASRRRYTVLADVPAGKQVSFPADCAGGAAPAFKALGQ